MKAEALIKIPKALNDDGRVGVIFGNYNKEKAINFEVHAQGTIRL